MIRLNQKIRDKIVNNAIDKSGIQRKLDELQKSRADWVEECRVYLLGGHEQSKKMDAALKRINKTLIQFPKSCTAEPFNTNNYLTFNIGGRRVCVAYDGRMVNRYKCEIYKITPGEELAIPVDHKLCHDFDELDRIEDEINNLKQDIIANARAVVCSVSTVKKLLEIWPEAKELLPKQEQKTVLPALPIGEINRLVGLPSES